MTTPAPDPATAADIAAEISATLPPEERAAQAAEIEYAARLLAELHAGRAERAQVETKLAGAVFAQLQAALPADRALISFAGAQVGDVKFGDVVGGDQFKNNIIIITPSWRWDDYGGEDLAWLEQLLGKDKQELQPTDRERWGRMDWSRAADTYRQEVLRLYGTMQIFGMSGPVPLTNVFTEVYLLDKPSAWRRHSIEELKKGTQEQADSVGKEQRREGVALATAQPRLFILGQPGAGKTTFLKHLVLQAAQGQIDAIPIFVSLKAWSDSRQDLMAFLVRQFTICSFPDARPFIESILMEGKALVLFDGLDEVNYEGGRHQRTTQAIREFAQRYGKSRMVITCRTAATEFTFEQFKYCELADFTQEQIEAFIGRWFQHDEAKHAAFLSAFARPENQRLGELARRPLLLTMLCLTFDETMAFPQRRAELYEEAIDALLKKWDSSRSIQRDQVYRKLSLGYKRQLLSELAAESFERGEFFIARRELAERVVRFLRRLPPTDQSEQIDGAVVLRAIEAQHGLLIERARDIYSFSHLTFHEYFAARYIADYPEESVLRGAVAQTVNPQWREVLLLTASMLSYRNGETFFQIWSDHLQEQIQANPALTKLMEWASQQAQLIAPPDLRIRATVLTITLIDQAIRHNQKIIDSLEHSDLARVRDLVGDLANNLASTLPRNLYRARENSIDIDVVFDLLKSSSRAGTFDINLATATAFDITFARARAYALDVAHALAKIAARVKPTYQANQSPMLEYLHWQGRQLTDKQMEALKDYLLNTEFLLDCLDLATINNRQAVLDRLLVPPGDVAGLTGHE